MRPGCYVEDCCRPSAVKGLCEMHYRRVLRTGSTGHCGSTRAGAEFDRAAIGPFLRWVMDDSALTTPYERFLHRELVA